MEGEDPRGGHRQVCEGDRARVGVSHGMVEVKLLCFRWLSPFLKLVYCDFLTLCQWFGREAIKQCKWLHCVVSTDERFMGALRMGDETPRYLYILSKCCSVCESGRTEICVGDITN